MHRRPDGRKEKDEMDGSTKRTRRRCGLAVVLVAALAVGASTANAADATVNPFACAVLGGGQATRPAGSTIVVRQGLAEQTRGVLVAVLAAQTTTVTVNGGATADLTDGWSAPQQAPDGSWTTFVQYPTGITLEAGQSLTLTLTVTLAHPVPEVLVPPAGGEPGKPVINATGSTSATCTVTGV
jgi:hypothetical protein